MIPFLRFPQLALILVLLATACAHQRPLASTATETDPRWIPIDSLAQQGLFASALELTDSVLAQAQRSGDWRNEFRAWMQRSTYMRNTGVEASVILQQLEARVLALSDTSFKVASAEERLQVSGRAFDRSNIPLRPLLHSVLAEAYWMHYSAERWRILERTPLSGPNDDIETWDQRRYMERVIAHATASLEAREILQGIPAQDLGVLLMDPYATTRTKSDGPSGKLRTGAFTDVAVFDLLARRAIALFSNSETRLTEAAWSFQLDDPRYFDLYETFAYRPIQHKDSSAWELQALLTYQQWERSHLSDDHPILLTDISLRRLAFVRQHSTLNNADSLYRNALEVLRSRVAELPIWSEVTVALAQWHVERAMLYQRLGDGAHKWEKRTAVEYCDAAIAHAPGSFGAKNAEALKARLDAPSLWLQMDEAVLPGQDFKVAVSYSNVPKVWLRVVEDPEDLNERRDWSDNRLEQLLKRRSLRQWSVELPDDGDMHEHLVELPVEGLPVGRYTLLVCEAESFRNRLEIIAHNSFQSTRLAVMERTGNEAMELLVLDRESGAPIVGAKAELFQQERTSAGQRYTKLGEERSDAEGRAQMPLSAKQGIMRWRVAQGADSYIGADRWSYPRNTAAVTDSLRSFLFTDRAIYRPGQTIHFKGIVTVDRGGTTAGKSAYRTAVMLFDVNGRQVDSIAVTTDAFGSFHGTTTAPGGLTGQMRLHERYGSRSFQVEEYKRPRFEVRMDPVNSAPKLGEEATVSAQAISYAGVPIGNAAVQYTVLREARMPWWRGRSKGFFPAWGRATQVASGTAETDAQGRFELRFVAQADPSLPRSADPTFSYTVEVAVTDINGETREGSSSLNVGYRSIDIDLALNDALERETADSIALQVRNLNGEALDLPMDIRVLRVQAPDRVFRSRLWERPDRTVLDSASHVQRFPHELFADEDDPQAWPTLDTVWQRVAWRASGKRLSLRDARTWAPGEYRIEVRVQDPQGEELLVQRSFTLFSSASGANAFRDPFRVEALNARVEPGEKAVLLFSSALPEGRILMELERDGRITERRTIVLSRGQERIELPVSESDRGGFVVHVSAVARGRHFTHTQPIDVPWSNKELRVEWMSFRDKLLPGAKEEWRLRISGPKGDRVSAQLLATLYDASLDQFAVPAWDMFQWPQYQARRHWNAIAPFGLKEGATEYPYERFMPADTTRQYPMLNTFGFDLGQYYRHFRGDKMLGSRTVGEVMVQSMDASVPPSGGVLLEEAKEELDNRAEDQAQAQSGVAGASPMRSDLRETAFFFPDLLTDRDGSVVLRFTMPDALTRWKLMGLAHTTDLKLASFSRETITQKTLMVTPGLPRFLREGDRIIVSAKVDVLDGAAMNGTARLELFDPRTNGGFQGAMGRAFPVRSFNAAPGKSAQVSWSIAVEPGVELVGMRISASAGQFTDGEEQVLPVLTDRVLVSESLPITVTKAGTHTFALEKLVEQGRSAAGGSTLRHHSLHLEYTPDPAWYAVQALPYLMEFPHECAEQIFSRYYANRLAASVVEKRPAIKAVFEAWRATAESSDKKSFISALEKNPELKSVLLEETPWVVEATNESERRARLGLLFDLDRMAKEESIALNKLAGMQLPNGAWPWFSGMQPSRSITQHIVVGLGHLERLGAADLRTDGPAQSMLQRAVRWLDAEAEKDHRERLRRMSRAELDEYRPAYHELQYLLARSYFPRWAATGATATAQQFLRESAALTWIGYSLQEQGMIAMVLARSGNDAKAQTILSSLLERATFSPELGMYWKSFVPGMEWNSFPTETHALLIEAFHEVSKDRTVVNGLRQYLLTLKRSTDWGNTKATAEACYALLITGEDPLRPKAPPRITVGGQALKPDAAEAGTGTFQHSWSAAQVKPAMGEVRITTTDDGLQWGALHWQYLEQMDKVSAHGGPFNITKQVLLKRTVEGSTTLVPLNAAGPLKPGDLLSVRIELRSDRWLDFVHLKDLRAAGLEPVEAISGYHYQDGLGYYQSIRDAAMHFFFDRIGPGTHVFTYDLRVAHSGEFSNGITSAQSMYAPEFGGHSEGLRITIE